MDEYPRRCVKQIEGWEKERNDLQTNKKITHERTDEYAAYIIESIVTNKPYYSEHTVLFGGLAEIAQLCKKEHIKYIDYESATITNAVLNRMEELFKSCVLVKEPQFIEDIRMMKTPQEIAF